MKERERKEERKRRKEKEKKKGKEKKKIPFAFAVLKTAHKFPSSFLGLFWSFYRKASA